MFRSFVTTYGALTGLSALGLARINRSGQIIDDNELPTIAVIVAARNEANNLPNLIASLAAQTYPEDKVTFWLVDDDSEDATLVIAQHAAIRDKRFRALSSDPDSPIASPKKRAIDTAIQQTDADWIITTDADCLPKPGWLKAMISFAKEDTGAILGYSPLIGGKEPAQWLLQGESWSSAALCAAGIGLGYPFNAFGRNFAFRRDVYIELGGYGGDATIASGDDDLFLQRIASKTDWRAVFAADPRAYVPSLVPEKGKTFNTKVRHMSVGPRYAPGWVAIGFIASLLFMGLALATVAASFRLISWKKVRAAWRFKWMFDSILTASAIRILGDVPRASLAMLTMTFAPFALWAIWPRALFGTVQWKGRKFERNRADREVALDDNK